MTTPSIPVNRTESRSLAVVRGSLPREMQRVKARDLIKSEGHRLALVATNDGIPVDKYDWWADIRRGRLNVFGGVLRLIDTLIAKGYPESLVQIIPETLREYVADQFKRPTNPPRRAA